MPFLTFIVHNDHIKDNHCQSTMVMENLIHKYFIHSKERMCGFYGYSKAI